MNRLFIVLEYKPEEFDVSISLYNEEGKLVESKEFSRVKQIVIDNCRVLVSKHLKNKPFVLIAEAFRFNIDLKENSLLYINGLS
ncbi:MAG: hypothetical protein QW607_09600 [Desulfurococcaceae archaeon]|uniref:Uncharacterized protein n=1 Tax=Staphylothermus marinus TaxID=2280 RepID=A0A7C4H9V8_STAMA